MISEQNQETVREILKELKFISNKLAEQMQINKFNEHEFKSINEKLDRAVSRLEVVEQTRTASKVLIRAVASVGAIAVVVFTGLQFYHEYLKNKPSTINHHHEIQKIKDEINLMNVKRI